MITRFFSILLALCLMSVAAFASRIDVKINKNSQKMEVFVDGEREYVWPVSTGGQGYDTPSGKFRAFRMEAEHKSEEWDDAPMPHSIFFTERGHAIHGSYSKRIGQRASHGCVRLSPENAEVLYSMVEENGLGNTYVEIKGGFFDFGSGPTTTIARRTSPFWGTRGSPVKALQRTVEKGERKVRRAGFASFFSSRPAKPKPIAVKKAVKPIKVKAAKVVRKKPIVVGSID